MNLQHKAWIEAVFAGVAKAREDSDDPTVKNMVGLQSNFSGVEAGFERQFHEPLYDLNRAISSEGKDLVGPLKELVDAGIVTARPSIQTNNRSSQYGIGEFTGYSIYRKGEMPPERIGATEDILAQAAQAALAASATQTATEAAQVSAP